MFDISFAFVALIVVLIFVLRRHFRHIGKTTDEAINHMDMIVKTNLKENEVDLIRRLNKVSEDLEGLQYSTFEEAYEALQKKKN